MYEVVEHGVGLEVDPASLEVSPVDSLLILRPHLALHDDSIGARRLGDDRVDLLERARQVTARDLVVVQEALAAGAEVLELHLIDIGGDELQVVVAVDDEAVVGLVAEVGRTVDIVHFHTSLLSVEVGTVHLTRMSHEDDQALVAAGETRESVVDMGIPSKFVLGIFRLGIDTVERVDDEDTHTTARHSPVGNREDIVERMTRIPCFLLIPPASLPIARKLHNPIFAEPRQDVADILVEPIDTGIVELAGHAGRRLEREAGELLAELAQVVDDRDILGREICNLPVVEQTETQAELVDEFRLAVARTAAHHHVPTRLESHQVVEPLHPDGSTALHAFIEQRQQLVAHIRGSLDADERDIVGSLDTFAHPIGTMSDQHIVGILAPIGPIYQQAMVGIQAADEFIAQHQPLLIVVESEHYTHLVVEVSLDETVQKTEVLLGTIGHRDGFEVSALDEGESIELPLGDVAERLAYDGVDVPRDEFSLREEREPLVDGTALDIDVFTLVEEVETDTSLLFLKPGIRQRDAASLHQVDVEASRHREILDERLSRRLGDTVLDEELSRERLRANVATLLRAIPEFLLAFPLHLFPRGSVLIGRHIARHTTVETVIQTAVDIHREAFLAPVIRPAIRAKRTSDTQLAVRGIADIDAVIFKVA